MSCLININKTESGLFKMIDSDTMKARVEILQSEGHSVVRDMLEVRERKFMSSEESVARLSKYFSKNRPNCKECICNKNPMFSFCKVGLRGAGSKITLCDLVELLRGRDNFIKR